MLKWLLTMMLAIMVLGALTPWLRRLGLNRLPGDIDIERDGKRYVFPFGSTLLLSLLATLLFWMLR